MNKLKATDPSWRNLYRVGAIAALIAALVFRRNLGAAEIPMLIGQTPPETVVGWFTLLHNNSLLGLSFLNIFDIIDYALVGMMFLALYFALRKTNKSITAIATVLGFVGIIVYFVSNTAFSMLSLSNQYASATTDTDKSMLLAAGQTLLDSGYNPSAIYPSTGILLSMLLLAVAGLIMSAVMLRTNIFSKKTAIVGILASAFDLAYLLGLTFVQAADVYLLSASCIATAGFLLLVWHLLIGLKLYRLSSTPQVKGGDSLE
jgi:hypothetical protein